MYRNNKMSKAHLHNKHTHMAERKRERERDFHWPCNDAVLKTEGDRCSNQAAIYSIFYCRHIHKFQSCIFTYIIIKLNAELLQHAAGLVEEHMCETHTHTNTLSNKFAIYFNIHDDRNKVK